MSTPHHRNPQASSRGFSRLEVTVAAGILGLVLAAGTWFFRSEADAGAKNAALSTAEQLLRAASDWKRETETPGCPSVSQLLLDKRIDKHAATDDPWGGRFRIICRDDKVSVMSAGGDGRFRTEDDISLAADWRS